MLLALLSFLASFPNAELYFFAPVDAVALAFAVRLYMRVYVVANRKGYEPSRSIYLVEEESVYNEEEPL